MPFLQVLKVDVPEEQKCSKVYSNQGFLKD